MHVHLHACMHARLVLWWHGAYSNLLCAGSVMVVAHPLFLIPPPQKAVQLRNDCFAGGPFEVGLSSQLTTTGQRRLQFH